MTSFEWVHWKEELKGDPRNIKCKIFFKSDSDTESCQRKYGDWRSEREYN